jgi:hypothetical protein
MLLEFIAPIKSPYQGAPYVAQLSLTERCEILTWREVVSLHDRLKQMCPQRFAWWVSLPPEIWITSLIYSHSGELTAEALPGESAMRIDLIPGRQFESLSVPLTGGQLITLRKISYRTRSDWEQYALDDQEYRGM